MKLEQAHKVIDDIYDDLMSENSIPSDIQKGKPIDTDRLDTLISNIESLIEHDPFKDEIPKKLVICFLDIYDKFTVEEGDYSEEECYRLQDVGIEIQDLAMQLLP